MRYPKSTVATLTFLFGTLLISYFKINPFAGFGLAFFFSWLIWEDFETQLIDMRIALGFLLVSIFVKPSGIITGLSYFFLMLIILYGTVKFVPKDSLTEEEQQDDCLLQEDIPIGFVPLLGLSSFIFLAINLLINIERHADMAVTAGNPVVSHFWTIYHNMNFICQQVASDPVYSYGLLFTLAVIAGALKLRIVKKEKEQGMAACYALGDGDPVVVGTLAGLYGSVIFFYVILMGALLFGEIQRLTRKIKQAIDQKYKEGACL